MVTPHILLLACGRACLLLLLGACYEVHDESLNVAHMSETITREECGACGAMRTTDGPLTLLVPLYSLCVVRGSSILTSSKLTVGASTAAA